MKILRVLFAICLLVQFANAQTDTTKSNIKLLLVPYPSMMYFSDADADIARFSNTNEPKVRNTIRQQVESNLYHQLSAAFDVVSLISATSLNGEEDLKKIYAASSYYLVNGKKIKDKRSSTLFRKKDKKEKVVVTDTSTMVAQIQDPNLNTALYQKHKHNYLVYISQFEINTGNKNTIEWLKQKYTREYVIHYNVWDNTGKLVLAETLTLEAEGENQLQTINEKYLRVMAEKVKDVFKSSLTP